ncbi:hypothetical protein ACG74X_11620 [Marivita sp. S0852]|uniref:hypothetical protein n=1 Tax=Marivita sp. S0852 TaxID=3373893 RepID=UPI00398218C9
MAQNTEKKMTDQAMDAARDVADDVADAASAKAKVEAENVRDTAAEETEKVANAAHAASEEFDSGSMQAQAIEQVAKQVDHIANQIRNTDIDRFARSVGDAAQRNPLMFVAGAALAGFAVTRFLNARDPSPSRSMGHDDPWQTHTRPGQGGYEYHPTAQRGV